MTAERDAAFWADGLRAAAGAESVVVADDRTPLSDRMSPFDRMPLFEVDGHPVHVRFRPDDGGTLAAGLEWLSREGAAVTVRGGGQLLHEGQPLERLDLVIDTEALSGVDEFEPDEGVAHARAGTPVRVLREKVEAEGWELPLDAVGPAASVGGTLAAAAVGPRAQAFGPARDAILGLEVALPDGSRTRCGGRVVKNVTGFDLAKLYAGSRGTLGVIEGAWLRLRPRPATVRTLQVRGAAPGDGCLAASRRATVRAALWLGPAAADRWLDAGDVGRGLWLCELGGAPEAVARDAEALSELGDVEPAPADALDRVRDRRARPPEPGSLRARVHALPTAAVVLAGDLAESFGTGAEIALQLALGELRCELDGDGLATATLLRDRAHGREGHAVIEALALEERRRVDCEGVPADSLRIMQALRRRFDPTGLLSPGRWAGLA